MELVVPDMRWGYVHVCDHVMEYGGRVNGRGGVTRELTGVTLEFEDPTRCMLPIGVNRKVNVTLAAIEALALVAGTWPHDLVLAVAPNYADVLVSKDPADAQAVAYGPRTVYQLDNLLRILHADPTTRQAVITIWRPSDLTWARDRPCTLSLQFLLRDDRLQLITTMRSQDVWFGLAMDVFVFTQLQHTVARMLGVGVGKYVHHLGSIHAYERDWDKIAALTYQYDITNDPGLPHGVVGGPDAARSLLSGVSDGEDGAFSSANEWYARHVIKAHSLLRMRQSAVATL